MEHEKVNFISTSSHVLFCLLYKHANDDFFDDFPKISKYFPKISEDSPKVVQMPDDPFRTFPKNSEEEPMMFRPYRNTSTYFLKDYVTIAMVIFSLLKVISIVIVAV